MTELMIVIAIIAVLATLSYPSYQTHVVETRRTMASACLVELSQWMERFYTSNMSYAGASLPTAPCDSEVNEFYAVAFVGTPDASTYSLSATAKGGQADRDGGCESLTINQHSVKQPAACW